MTTIAGTGVAGFSGEGGTATAARINSPSSVVVDASGNIFISDNQNYRVRKISPSGIITTVAGTGTYGFTGDRGAATAARIGRPEGLCIDATGNLYLADRDNQRIRKISPSGIITTVAGGGTVTGDGGAATSAVLNYPYGVGVDATGKIYISETSSNKIRMVSTSGTISTTAGTGTGGSTGDGGAAATATTYLPMDIAVDASGNIYFPEDLNHRVRKLYTYCPMPSIAGIAGPSSVRIGANITLTNSVTGGSWLTASAAIASINPTTGVVRGVAAGRTAISYITSNCCGSSLTTYYVTVTASKENGEMPTETMADLTVYPNPTTGILNIALPEAADQCDVYVTDMNGKTTVLGQQQGQRLNIDLSGFATGTYALKLVTPARAFITLVTKQ